jgi:hypothetical protein
MMNPIECSIVPKSMAFSDLVFMELPAGSMASSSSLRDHTFQLFPIDKSTWRGELYLCLVLPLSWLVVSPFYCTFPFLSGPVNVGDRVICMEEL